MKKCKICGIEKDKDCFNKVQRNSPYFRGYCKSCHVEDSRKREIENPEQAKIRKVRWDQKNKEKMKISRVHKKESKRDYDSKRYQLKKDDIKEYQKANKKKIRAYEQTKYENDINYRLAKILRRRIWYVLRSKPKKGSAVNDLGCSIEILRQWLESKFKPGMAWDNYGRDSWHVDHVIPLAAFDLTDQYQFKLACHYTNLQPLWAAENHSKGSRII